MADDRDESLLTFDFEQALPCNTRLHGVYPGHPVRQCMLKARHVVFVLFCAISSGCGSLVLPNDDNHNPYLRAWMQSDETLLSDRSRQHYLKRLALIDSRQFRHTQTSLQHHRLTETAQFGKELGELSSAYTLSIRASAMTPLEAKDWDLRFLLACRLGNRADAAIALTRIAEQWPAMLSGYSQQTVFWTVYPSSQKDKIEDDLLSLRLALYRASWTLDFGVAPAELWAGLAADLALRGKQNAALEIVAHSNAPRELLSMRIDKRFDSFIRRRPELFDVALAAKRRIEDWEAAVKTHPRALQAVIELTYAYLDAGRYEDTLTLTESIIERINRAETFAKEFDDEPTTYNWLLDNHARALLALGRWDEARAEFRSAATRKENGSANMSNAINFASALTDHGSGDEAMAILNSVPTEKLSTYGKMQWHRTRLQAAVTRNDEALLNDSLTYLKRHAKDSRSTYLLALVRANRLETAAHYLIRRLLDIDSRSWALQLVQNYSDSPAPQELQQQRNNLQKVVLRPDVQYAISEVGHIEQVPLPSELK